MASRPYPVVHEETIEAITNILRDIIRTRTFDVNDFTNLKNVFLSGRKVEKTPSASNDIDVTDRENDFNWSPTYLYVCVNNAGTLVWRRVALSSW